MGIKISLFLILYSPIDIIHNTKYQVITIGFFIKFFDTIKLKKYTRKLGIRILLFKTLLPDLKNKLKLNFNTDNKLTVTK